MSFIELANQHQREYNANRMHLSRPYSYGASTLDEKYKIDINKVIMPFYETTLNTKSASVLQQLQSPNSFAHPRSSTPINLNIPSPSSAPSPQFSPTDSKGISAPFHSSISPKGILKNSPRSKAVTFNGESPLYTGISSTSPPEEGLRRTTSSYFNDLKGSSCIYKPAVLPSNKKTFKLGDTWVPLSNRPDPEVIEQLGGITKTIDTMTQTLREHELRPYEFCTVRDEPLISSQYQRANRIEHNLYGNGDENGKRILRKQKENEFFKQHKRNTDRKRRIISCSPFRAFCCDQ